MSVVIDGKYLILKDRHYTETDEWILINGNIATVGITDYAQKKLKDIVGIELPQVGREVTIGEQVAVVESVKAAADIFSPLSGSVLEVNKELQSSPETINKDPYGRGWIFKLKIKDEKEVSKLLNFEQYIISIKQREGI
ncbi:glycine cleavage system protein GcvH [Sulfolobus acidocaldarius]|uniref:Probable glycine cleavage system H protein 1 n=4 Tax=Sulfolobus acidocaldarius TaxID=2285 RepID=GCSH1_SULAC|nr:glycine cleavage system protein GcvH [Sulfolobus acidocaldarius]Q4J912.1 RecName: Full=Probable glycine cleavage system H protein 1 [Sulfolobus acidocaldarius DSM 639]AAY80717.1 glycine cleavage system H protein [Sulfolobus acidocaldarius DSM 639]AGE71314.1 glycine cleavage system protein H [Sulfolobus acidocaldarius N8]AGE73583.1 glycine cleavage system protein H [Sulfolobus acidocaldarius Ron12/I]ALU30430.1 glycine cleavage system protein H [Sulfolobus acidocaldarius]ALU31151.1 glycine c